jgi:hypothetical protein
MKKFYPLFKKIKAIWDHQARNSISSKSFFSIGQSGHPSFTKKVNVYDWLSPSAVTVKRKE